MNDKRYTTKEAAEYLGIETETLRWNIRSGRLPAVKFGTQWMLVQSDLDHFRDNPPKLGRPPRGKD